MPTRLGNLGNLRLLALDNNQLSGPVPLGLADLDNLTTLRLSGNQLSGCAPVGLKDVATNDLASLGLDDCPVDTSDPVDRAALVAFYESTGGPNWTDNTGWLSGAPVKDWEGVTTDENGRVIQIVLPVHNLSGTLPLDFGLLTELNTLQLSGNSLTGELPPTSGPPHRIGGDFPWWQRVHRLHTWRTGQPSAGGHFLHWPGALPKDSVPERGQR